MEIKNYINAVNAYNQTKYDRSKTESATVTASTKNTDKVEFSSKQASINSLKSSISANVLETASADRIVGLTYNINSGKYNIASELVAKSILE